MSGLILQTFSLGRVWKYLDVKSRESVLCLLLLAKRGSFVDSYDILELISRRVCTVPAPTSADVRQGVNGCVRSGDARGLARLICQGHDLHHRDPRGRSVLHWAAWQGSCDAMWLLLDRGCSSDVIDANGNTPLHWATAYGHVGVVRCLAPLGEINAKNKLGYGPLHTAAESASALLLHSLLDAGADILMRDGAARTPLHVAATHGNGEAVDALIQWTTTTTTGRGATDGRHPTVCPEHHEALRAVLDVVDEHGRTPLYYAAAEGHEAIVRRLVLAAHVPCVSDVRRWTPLHAAAAAGHTLVVSALMSLCGGRTVGLLDKRGMQPAELGKQNGHDVAQLLQEHKV